MKQKTIVFAEKFYQLHFLKLLIAYSKTLINYSFHTESVILFGIFDFSTDGQYMESVC